MDGALPAEVTSFVGRRQELADVRRLLSTSRLVTLTGTGGVGKTRLATRAATALRRGFSDGVRFVDLATLSDPALLPQTTAAALGLRDETMRAVDRLADHLADQRLLLVLDNCEHVTDACASLIGKLLAAAPGLRVLATSRQRLGVEGEHVLPIEPFSVPDGEADAVGHESLTLFSDRAAAVSPDFSLSKENRSVVVGICRQLDGLPLAIELAAVWLRALSPREIYDRLDDKFALLTGGIRTAHPRQRGLDALVGWSYQLCSPEEQAAWARLSVFKGGFDVADAEAVCTGGGVAREDVVHLLASLVDKSVLGRESDTYGRGARYRMIETLAQFGAARLAESEESAEVWTRFREHYRLLGREYAEQEFSDRQLNWVLRLQREHANLRRALDSLLAQPDLRPALELAANLSTYWIAGGHLAEGYGWLGRALDAGGPPSRERAQGLHAWLYLGTWLGVHKSFRTRIPEYRAVATELADPVLLARFRVCEGITAYFLGDRAEACAVLEEALPACLEVGQQEALASQGMAYLVALQFLLGKPDAEQTGQRAVALCEDRGSPPWHTAYALWALGLGVLQRGDVNGAAELQREAIRLRRPMNDHSGIALSLEAVAWCAASQHRFTEAARLLGAATMVWKLSGAGQIEPALREVSRTRCADPARAALGAAAFDEAVAEGESLDLDHAVALALGEPPPTAAAPGSGGKEPARLTRRETEVAALVGEGLSNKEIATRLVISQRTAETHVEHILTKLGFTSRAQVATWFANQDHA